METVWKTRLRSAGLRVTRPRLSVLGVLAERPHADADAIATAARAAHPSISPQAVYGVLRALVGGGLARRIEPAGGPALYELRVGDNHHHLVCRDCGTVADVDCAVGAAPCLVPSDAAGFVVDEAEVVFWGSCADCRGERSRRGHRAGSATSGSGADLGSTLDPGSTSDRNRRTIEEGVGE